MLRLNLKLKHSCNNNNDYKSAAEQIIISCQPHQTSRIKLLKYLLDCHKHVLPPFMVITQQNAIIVQNWSFLNSINNSLNDQSNICVIKNSNHANSI